MEPRLSGLRVLVVDDDKELVASICSGLEAEGCMVLWAYEGGSVLRHAELQAFDVLLLDVIMPVLDGVEVTKRLRLQGYAVPIVLLSGLGSAQDVVRGLNAGADDYLTKPFDFEVLIARLRARSRSALPEGRQLLRFADLILDAERHEASRAGNKLDLTRTEFSILECLIRAAGRVAPKEHILATVWTDKDVSGNNLETFIRFLRQKVDRPGLARLIHTRRGVGYYLREIRP